MQPRERQETGEQDLFRSRLDRIMITSRIFRTFRIGGFFIH